MTAVDHRLKIQGFVLGYVGAVGSPLERAISLVHTTLHQKYRYAEPDELSATVRISSLWGTQTAVDDPDGMSFSRLKRVNEIASAMSRGNVACQAARKTNHLAALAITAIEQRFTPPPAVGHRPDWEALNGVAHIRSLKRPEEVELLRERFGPRFFLIGVHASRDWRRTELARQIERDEPTAQVDLARAAAEYLIQRDERERESDAYGKFGQNVRGTLQLADAVVSGETPAQLEAQLARVLRLLFRHPFETPTIEEAGMMQAAVAARQSAALGRQVGAAVHNEAGDLLATGYNEVPAVGGGHLRPGTHVDRRDYVMGWNESKRRNDLLLKRVVDVVQGAIRPASSQSAPSSAANDEAHAPPALETDAPGNPVPALSEQSRKDLRNGLKLAGLESLIEFGRDVHAEQSAICTAARLGRPLAGGTMYVTTFPCHLCAKHIIATGINRVVFVEPYAKSRAEELFDGLLSVDEVRAGHVLFQRHVGVAPRAYFDLFDVPSALREEATTGAAREWHEATAAPWFWRPPAKDETATQRPVAVEESAVVLRTTDEGPSLSKTAGDRGREPDGATGGEKGNR